MNRVTWTVLSQVMVLGLLAACGPAPTAATPPRVDDGWPTASPADVGLDAVKLEQAVAAIRSGAYQNIHSLLVVKDGKLVFEQYFRGHAWSWTADQFQGKIVDFDRDTLHYMASVSKSVTSILVGIAIDQGAIRGAQEKVFACLPGYAHLQDDGKELLTLEHLLTMTSGLAWNENELPYSDPQNDLYRMHSAADPVAYILSRPLAGAPGQDFYYSGGNVNLLGAVVGAATGQRLDAFAEQHLFAPLGISEYDWDLVRPELVDAAGGLHLRPRDMARLGLLYLNGGEWNGQRIVSREWVEASTQPHASPPTGGTYGYLWWERAYDLGAGSVEAFYAAGWGGQRILVLSDLDMVVVLTGGNYVGTDPVDDIITRFILPAVH